MTASARRDSLQVTVVGGGMITHDQILPSLYHMQRQGQIGPIRVCALNSAPLRALAESPRLREAFPGQAFEAVPPLDDSPQRTYPENYKQVIAQMPPHNLVVVARAGPFSRPR